MLIPESIPLPEDLEYALDREPGTTCLVTGEPEKTPLVALVIKRTYRYDDRGRPTLAPDEEQHLVHEEELVYESLDPPLVSPIEFDEDARAFRRKTDLVVQGHAYAYGESVSHTKVGLRLGELEREIVVHGDRSLILRADGRMEFGPAADFESIPLRYDRAYGGVDRAALARFHSPELEELKFARPEWQLDCASVFHYARNPAGRGFLIEADEESVALAQAPNLEYEFDPVTPERLAVGSLENWLAGPLPAAWDWFSLDWFPRVAYLGEAEWPEDEPAASLPVKEIELGWAAADLRRIPSWMRNPEEPLRLECMQAASPGLALEDVPLDEPLRLTNLHPQRPEIEWRLPQETPHVVLEIGGQRLEMSPQLNAIVARPDQDELIMTWCASAPGMPRYTARQLRAMQQEVSWRIFDG